MSWLRILAGGVLAFVGSYATVFLIVTGYAFKLAFEARGQPDADRIQAFAEWVGPAWGPWVSAMFVFVAAYLVARKVAGSRPLHGLLVGSVSSVLGIGLSWPFEPRHLIGLGLSLAAGAIGGAVASWGGGVAESS